jgi:hypothetical protein
MSDGYDRAQRNYDNATPPDDPDDGRYWLIGRNRCGRRYVHNGDKSTTILCVTMDSAKRIAEFLESEGAS